jgi:hypothetical protein
LIPPTLSDDRPAVVAEIVDGLSGDNGLPRGALRRAVENWEQALPVFLDMLEAYIDNPEPNEADADPLFFILHLFGQMRETRAYPLLMRFAAMAPAHVERVLGDAITATFSRVAASVFDGNPQPMRHAILDEQADEFIRNGLLEALALVARDGRADRADTAAFLEQCYTDLKPERDSYVWAGWQSAISYLGLSELTDLVRRAFISGRIDPSIMSFRHFEQDLAAIRADPAGAGPGHGEIGYFGDAIAELSHWHAFSEAARRPQPELVDQAAANHMPVVTRSVKQRGRPRGNDPCPCGSGKKYKKCCRDA